MKIVSFSLVCLLFTSLHIVSCEKNSRGSLGCNRDFESDFGFDLNAGKDGEEVFGISKDIENDVFVGRNQQKYIDRRHSRHPFIRTKIDKDCIIPPVIILMKATGNNGVRLAFVSNFDLRNSDKQVDGLNHFLKKERAIFGGFNNVRASIFIPENERTSMKSVYRLPISFEKYRTYACANILSTILNPSYNLDEPNYTCFGYDINILDAVYRDYEDMVKKNIVSKHPDYQAVIGLINNDCFNFQLEGRGVFFPAALKTICFLSRKIK